MLAFMAFDAGVVLVLHLAALAALVRFLVRGVK